MCAVFIPWCVFAMVVFEFVHSYHLGKDYVWTFIAACFITGVLVVVVGFGRDKSVQMATGLLIILAVCIGSTIGIYIWLTYGHTYYQMEDGAEYYHVSPTAKGTDYADAAVIHFESDSFVDTARTLGYMEAGTVYCVAPISPSKESNTPQFWAAGKDCCGERSDFKCDDIHVNKQKSAVAVISDADRESYKTAIRMAESVYSLDAKQSGQVPMQWISAEANLREDKWNSMIFWEALSTGLYLICSLLAGVILRKSMMRNNSWPFYTENPFPK